MNDRGLCRASGAQDRWHTIRMRPDRLWDKWLRFRDPVLESRFRGSCMESLKDVDLLVMTNTFLRLGLLYVALAAKRDTVGIAFHLEVTFLAVLLAVTLFRKACGTKEGFPGRTLWIGAQRLMVAISSTKAQELLEEPEGHTAWGVLHHLMLESTATQMGVLSLGLPLQFKEHVLAHSLCLLACATWACPMYCRAWGGSGGRGPVFHRMASVIDKGVTLVSSFGMTSGKTSDPGEVGDGTDDPCWMVLAFFHAAAGFVIPTVILYIGEIHVRLKFLAKIGLDVPWKVRLALCRDRAFMLCWVAVVALMCVWVLLRLLHGGLNLD